MNTNFSSGITDLVQFRQAVHFLHTAVYIHTFGSHTVLFVYGDNIKSKYTDINLYCRDRVSSSNIYAVQQDTQSVLMSEFIQHCLLARHVSDLIVLLDTSSWTCRVVRVLPHTKSANTACTKRY